MTFIRIILPLVFMALSLSLAACSWTAPDRDDSYSYGGYQEPYNPGTAYGSQPSYDTGHRMERAYSPPSHSGGSGHSSSGGGGHSSSGGSGSGGSIHKAPSYPSVPSTPSPAPSSHDPFEVKTFRK